MPLKGDIIAGFGRLKRDCSLPVKALFVLSGKRTPGVYLGRGKIFLSFFLTGLN
jgi:hypothetical protein